MSLKNKITQCPVSFGPMVHCTKCKLYLPTTNLWLVFYPNNPKSLNLVVSCPYVSYYLYLHTFMLFRSTCSGIFL